MSEGKTMCGAVSCAYDEKPFLFVSYAHNDTDRVFPVIDNLWREGYAIWFDRGINISSTWTDEIAIAIINCEIFLVFLSKNSVDSAYVRSEIEYALNKKKKIIPVYLDGMSVLPPGLELGLNSTQGITDAKNTEEITGKIKNSLEFNRLGKTARDENIKTAAQNGGGKAKKRSVGAIVAVILAMIVYNIFMGRASEVKPLALEKTVFRPAEAIFVAIPDAALLDRNPIIGVSSADASQGNFISYVPVKESGAPVKLRSPEEHGQYEIRLYKDDTNLAESSMLGIGKFRVEGNASGLFGVSADKSGYVPGEEIVVSVSGVPRQCIDDRACIALHRTGADGGEYLVYIWIGEREFKTSFEMPAEPGSYEIRTYANGDIRTQATLVSSIAVGVVSDDADVPPLVFDTPPALPVGVVSDDAGVFTDAPSLDLPD